MRGAVERMGVATDIGQNPLSANRVSDAGIEISIRVIPRLVARRMDMATKKRRGPAAGRSQGIGGGRRWQVQAVQADTGGNYVTVTLERPAADRRSQERLTLAMDEEQSAAFEVALSMARLDAFPK